MLNIKTALATGAEPNMSDALTVNGEPGDLYPCSKQGIIHCVNYTILLNKFHKYFLFLGFLTQPKKYQLYFSIIILFA